LSKAARDPPDAVAAFNAFGELGFAFNLAYDVRSTSANRRSLGPLPAIRNSVHGDLRQNAIVHSRLIASTRVFVSSDALGGKAAASRPAG
jgi:hypothetical protein